MNNKEVFIHQVQLPSTDEFSKKFNTVSDLFVYWQQQQEGTEEEINAWNAFFEAKYRLEQGI